MEMELISGFPLKHSTEKERKINESGKLEKNKKFRSIGREKSFQFSTFI